MTNHLKQRNLSAAVLAASAGALAAAGPQEAQANDAVSLGDQGLTLSFEGGAAFADYTRDVVDSIGKFGDHDRDLGGYGSVSLSKALPNNWDWKLSASHLGLPENADTETDGEFAITTSGEMSASFVELDFGRTHVQGATEARLGVGLVGGRVSQAVDKGFFSGSGSVDSSFSRDFHGFGPTFSADVSHRLPTARPFRLEAGASLTPMFGSYTQDKGIDFDGSEFNASDSADGQLMHAAAYAGLAYDFGESSSFRFGVRLDKFGSNEVDFEDFGTDDGLLDDTLTKTAYVGVSINF